MTSTRHDELVEEIRWLICPVCEFYNPDCERCDSAAGLCDEVIVATDLILTATRKAVVDGKVKLPGEVGRGNKRTFRLFREGVKGWMNWIGRKKSEELTFIALSPTGEEEDG